MTEKRQFKHVPHGTNSPPLRDNKPMGASCIDGTQQAGYVSDAKQREGEIIFFFCFLFAIGFPFKEGSVCLYISLSIDYFGLVSNWH